jgi:serine/threonine protein kinase
MDAGFRPDVLLHHDDYLATGTTLDRLRIEAEIGRGGMGVVYRAYDERLDRRVAVKVISSALGSQASFRKRFLTEMRAMASLDSPFILPVFHSGESDGLLYMVTGYVEDGDLGALLNNSTVSLPDSLRVVSQVAIALDYAHGAGVIHRDVKPSNILVRFDDNGRFSKALLADFGLCRLYESGEHTLTGGPVGSLEYMAPEQVRGERPGPRVDQYALACVASRLILGTTPFKRESAAAMLSSHLADVRSWPDDILWTNEGSTRPVFERAFRVDPEVRHADCVSFANALFNAMSSPSSSRHPKRIAEFRTQPTLGQDGSGSDHKARRIAIFLFVMITLIALGLVLALGARQLA